MSPAPSHGTPAGDAFLALSKLARGTDQDAQDVFTMYALEGCSPAWRPPRAATISS